MTHPCERGSCVYVLCILKVLRSDDHIKFSMTLDLYSFSIMCYISRRCVTNISGQEKNTITQLKDELFLSSQHTVSTLHTITQRTTMRGSVIDTTSIDTLNSFYTSLTHLNTKWIQASHKVPSIS